VTSSSGAVDTTYRYVSVYQKPSQGTNNPIEAWELSELSGSRSEGGYTARIKIMSIMPELQPHTLVVIWAEDTYGGYPISLGGNSQNNESIVFNGYVLEDSIRFNYKESTMEFSIGSPSEIMKESEGFSVSCESKASASKWYELTEMTIQKALYHYLRWHSTFLNVNDFQYTGDDRYLQYFDSDRESLFDAVDNFMRNGLLGAAVCDRQGKMWAEISHYGLENPFTDIPTNPLYPNKQDWMGDPTIQERRDSDTSFVELGGIAYYGTASNTFSALISNAPGTTPLYHGKTERQEGLILLSQLQLNKVAANYLAYKNASFPEVNLPINGNYRNIDIAPQEKFYLVVSPSDTIRNVSLQDKPYTPTSMTWTYRSDKQTFIPELTLEQMATGTMAETVLIPVTPPYQQSGFDYPALQLPTFPVFNPPDAVGPASNMSLILHNTSSFLGGGGFVYTQDFDSGNPHYTLVNGGIPEAIAITCDFCFVTPNGAFYVGKRSLTGTEGFIARAPYVGGIFTMLYDSTNLNIGGGGSYGVCAASFNPEQPESVALVLKFSNADPHVFYYGANTSFAAGAAVDTGNFVGNLSFGLNTWLYTSYVRWVTVTVGGSLITSSNATNIFLEHYRGASTSGHTIHKNKDNTTWFIGENNMATITTILDTNLRTEGMAVAISPDGLQLMAQYNAGGNKFKSNDGGVNWTAMPNLPVGNWTWAYAGAGTSSSQWVAAGGTAIRYSPDFGVSWFNKEGDFAQAVTSVYAIDMLFVPGVTQQRSFVAVP
jgi:hypothetical protein